jgi:hypothetical protein
MRRIVMVVSAGALLLPGLCGAAAASATAGSHPLPAMARPSAARQWLAQQLGAMRQLDGGRGFVVTPDLPANGPNEFADNASLLAVGDLNGDSRRDVLDLRQSPYSPTAEGLLGVTTRDGRTGRALWTRLLTEQPNDDMVVMPERLGAKGKAGILTIESYTTASGNTPVSGNLRFRALSGSRGRLLWSRTLAGSFGAGGTQASIPSLDGMFHNAKGADNSALVSLETTLPAPSGDRTAPETVSDADGSLQTPGDSFTSTTNYPSLQPIGDVNGDGLADILVLSPGSPGFERAETGNTGAQIWQSSVVPIPGILDGAMTVGHFSHRDYPDIAIEVGNFDVTPPQITVLDGRTGRVVWTRMADTLYLLGTAGKHQVPAVGLETDSEGGGSTEFSDILRFKAVTAANKVLYNKLVTVSVAMPAGPPSTGTTTNVVPLGDVEPDGSIERTVDVTVQAESGALVNSKTIDGYVDGRLGRFRKVNFNAEAAGSLHHGNGTDLLALDLLDGKPQLTALKGTTRTLYYKRALPALHGIQEAQVTGIRVSGQPCSDLSVATVKSTQSVLGIMSARAAWLWRVSFTQTQLTGGTLKHYKAPKHFCV